MPEFFSEMMPRMLPKCLNAFLSELPEEKRIEFTKKMASVFLQNIHAQDRAIIFEQG